jgi:hypothetical protein
MTATPPETFHGWPDLPNEIKLEVLAHYLSRTTTIDADTHASIVEGDLGQLISTRNRELVACAIDSYYKSNTFRAKINFNYVDNTGVNDYFSMKYPPAAHGAHIRHLEIDILECNFGYSFEDTLLPSRSGWRFLLNLTRPLNITAYNRNPYQYRLPAELSRQDEWQARFPHLRTLKVKMCVCDSTDGLYSLEEFCCLRPSRV